jgi:hypothetical protein
MPTHHGLIELVAGDPWEIPGTLTDDNGQPLDLTNAQFEWALVDTGRNPITLAAAVDVIDAAAGVLGIYVRASDTAGLDPGYYTDALRVKLPSAGGATVWHGQILVVANPFT